jgi:hypothetical protein
MTTLTCTAAGCEPDCAIETTDEPLQVVGSVNVAEVEVTDRGAVGSTSQLT